MGVRMGVIQGTAAGPALNSARPSSTSGWSARATWSPSPLWLLRPLPAALRGLAGGRTSRGCGFENL